MERRWKLAFALVFALSLGACSGAQTSDDEEAGSDETIAQDAETDAVPQDQLEALPETDQAGLEGLPAEEPQAPAAQPEEPPFESSAPAQAYASGDTSDYTVQAGDTLMKIAFESYGDLYQWRRIYELNRDKIPDINRLSKGVVLKVERPGSPVAIDRNGERYLIKAGDTLGSISDDVYGTRNKWRKLYENNRQMIKDPNRIYAGFYLYYLMSDEDQRERENFLQNKGPAPMAGGGAPPVQSQPIPQPAEGGLIDPMGGGQGRAPTGAPGQ